MDSTAGPLSQSITACLPVYKCRSSCASVCRTNPTVLSPCPSAWSACLSVWLAIHQSASNCLSAMINYSLLLSPRQRQTGLDSVFSTRTLSMVHTDPHHRTIHPRTTFTKPACLPCNETISIKREREPAHIWHLKCYLCSWFPSTVVHGYPGNRTNESASHE